MKKILSIFILLLLLGGCTKEPPAAQASVPTITASPTAALEETPAPSPSALAMAVPTPPATPTPSPSPTPSPTPVPTPTPTPIPTPFSLVVFPDTQAQAYGDPELFPQLRDWVEGHRESDNILGIIHTGDIVDNGFKDWEWENVSPLLEAVSDDLFFFPVAGNHDIGTQAKSYSGYLKQSFLDAYPSEQKFEGGKMLYRILSSGGQDFLLLGAGWNSYQNASARRWLDAVLADHAGMPCIFVTHGFLLSNGGYFSSVEQLVARYPAIRLVICGHSRDYQTRVFSYDDDKDGVEERNVNVIMLNMQEKKEYAFRLLTFDPLTHDIAVKTFASDGSLFYDIPGAGPISFTLNSAY